MKKLISAVLIATCAMTASGANTEERMIVNRIGMQEIIMGLCSEIVEDTLASSDTLDTIENRKAIFGGCVDNALERLKPMPVQ